MNVIGPLLSASWNGPITTDIAECVSCLKVHVSFGSIYPVMSGKASVSQGMGWEPKLPLR